MTTEQLFAMWTALEKLGGPDFGLDLTNTTQGSTLPPSFLVAFHAKNGRSALQRLARFKELCAPERFEITFQNNLCAITTNWTYATEPEPDSLIDATFSFMVNLLRVGTGQQIVPKTVQLRRASSKALVEWFGCPIIWNARQARLVFQAADLELPFTTYNRELLEMLDKALAADLSKAQRSGSLTLQVRWHLRRAFTAGRPELRSIARDMAISERSLQRRLKEEGHSFQALLSDTRHELACEYLIEPGFDISEIAYLLGYEDQGSFYRAFQRWEGQTPAEWRETSLTTTNRVLAQRETVP